MPKICCKLHRLLDSKNISCQIKNDKFEDFCKFIQQSWIKRSKTTIQYENPNDMTIYVYLFAGAGTRYLSGLAGQFITFQPRKSIKQAIKWYPVLATKEMPETKSLSFLGKTKLPISLLLLLSYEKNYLCHHIHYNIVFHMTIPIQMQCLLFMLSISPDADLHAMIGERLTSITMCDDSPLINIFETSDQSESITKRKKITINNFFPDFLCENCKDPIHNDDGEIPLEDSWNTAMTTVLMHHKWTEISDPSLNPRNQTTATEKRISKDSSPYYGKRSLTATITTPSKILRQDRQPVILSARALETQQSTDQAPDQQQMGIQNAAMTLSQMPHLNLMNPFPFPQTDFCSFQIRQPRPQSHPPNQPVPAYFQI